jgi:peptidoglycan-N-acetylglucosamine deacetylase
VNFKTNNILFGVLLLLTISLDMLYSLPFYSYLVLLFCYSLILFYGCYFVSSNFFINVICSAKTTQKQIAISFDDGPTAFTPHILEILKQKNTSATFFCIGNRIIDNELIVNQIHNEGHLIGNHSHSHSFWFDMLSANEMMDDLQQMNRAVQAIIGLRPRLFRPPYGVTNPNLSKAILQNKLIPIGWNIRSMDTVINNHQTLFDRVTKRLENGAIVLFHDTNPTTLSVLPAFIDYATAQGYQIVRLDKLLAIDGYE